MDYKDVGVDLSIYNQTIASLAPILQSTFTPKVIPNIGGFAGLYELGQGYKNPVLVTCTDGVGSKLQLACAAEKYDTIGIDLVAMSVNDCICTGATPLVFLDYIAMHHDDPVLTAEVIRGIAKGCSQAGCALIGGETAILPGTYAPGTFDLAGYCLGVVEKDRIIDGRKIQPLDKIVGIASSGPHSNGYTLIRAIIQKTPEIAPIIIEALLKPTIIYTEAIANLQSHYRKKQVIHGIAHITGGGITDNLSRIVPHELDILIDYDSWSMPAIFQWIQKLGGIGTTEMYSVFNMGIGMALVVSPSFANSIVRKLEEIGQSAWIIGAVL